MNRYALIGPAILMLLVGALAGCTTPPERDVLTDPASHLRLRSMQTRAFDTADRNKVLRSVVATLQDLEFMIEAADGELGSVAARKFNVTRSEGVNDLKLTVTVRPREGGQTLVRANAEFNRKPVDNPEFYQRFFTALGKSLFLSAQQVE